MTELLAFDDVAQAIVALNWVDIRFGIEEHLLHPDYAIDLAVQLANEGHELSEMEMSLACLQRGESPMEILNTMLPKQSEEASNSSRMKIMNLLLCQVVSQSKDLETATEVLEGIYADFGYPPALAPFIRYMPVDPDKPRVDFHSFDEYTKTLKASIPLRTDEDGVSGS